jgi:hypothetical protein
MGTTLYSWNVNGLRAAQRHGFEDWLALTQPDILGLQEIKAMPEQLSDSLREPESYQAFWRGGQSLPTLIVLSLSPRMCRTDRATIVGCPSRWLIRLNY